MIIDYKLYYQPKGTVMKYLEFNSKNDVEANDFAKTYCENTSSKLVKLEKITIEKLI